MQIKAYDKTTIQLAMSNDEFAMLWDIVMATADNYGKMNQDDLEFTKEEAEEFLRKFTAMGQRLNELDGIK